VTDSSGLHRQQALTEISEVIYNASDNDEGTHNVKLSEARVYAHHVLDAGYRKPSPHVVNSIGELKDYMTILPHGSMRPLWFYRGELFLPGVYEAVPAGRTTFPATVLTDGSR